MMHEKLIYMGAEFDHLPGILQGMTVKKLQLYSINLFYVPRFGEGIDEGQSLFSDIYQMMNDLGFNYYGAMDQLFDPRDGTPI